MNDEDKYRLQGNQAFLVENLKVNDIQDHLLGEFLITDEESERLSNITRYESSNEAARKLLVILRKSKEPNCYKLFCDALNKTGYGFIVDTLRKTDVGKIKEKIQRDQRQTDDQVDKLSKQVWVQQELMMQLKQDVDGMKEKVSAYDELVGKLKEMGMKSGSVEVMARFVEKGGFNKPDPSIASGSIEMQQDRLYREMNEVQSQANFPKPPAKARPEEDDMMDIAESAARPLSPRKPKTKSIARNIGKDIAFYLVAKKRNLKIHEPPNEYAAAMRQMVDDLIEIHEDTFQKTLRNLDLDTLTGFQAVVYIFDELFQEGTTNWGRIVALYAYGGYIAMNTSFNLQDKNTFQNIATMGDFLGHYVDEKLDSWIQKQGGWVSVAKYSLCTRHALHSSSIVK